MKKNAAFTLIELLVVIAIIAILAAILFPVFAKAREKARQTTCASNEKQLGLGFMQYYQDYDETLPRGLPRGGDPSYRLSEGVGWAGQIYPYVKSTSIYKCPDDTTSSTTNSSGKAAVPVSYGMNCNIPRGDQAAGKISVLNAPASVVLLMEVTGTTADVTDPMEDGWNNNSDPHSGSGQGNENWNTGNGSNSSTYKLATGYMGKRGTAMNSGGFASPTGLHSNGANYLMCDGHVKWLTGAAVSDGSGLSKNASEVEANGNGFTASSGSSWDQAEGTAGPDGFVATFSPY